MNSADTVWGSTTIRYGPKLVKSLNVKCFVARKCTIVKTGAVEDISNEISYCAVEGGTGEGDVGIWGTKQPHSLAVGSCL